MDGILIEVGPDLESDSAATQSISASVGVELERTALPAALNRARTHEHLQKFVAEYLPVGPTEQALVRDLARQLAALERWSEAAEAVERHAARTLPEVANTFAEFDDVLQDAVLSGAMVTAAADSCERHSLARSRSFCRTLSKLQELQARRQARDQTGPLSIPPAFRDEAACAAYLEQRLRSPAQRCEKCGSPEGCFLPSRRAWECGRCGKQHGLRSGTVMAGSALPLLAWCEAIRWLLWRPTLNTPELAMHIGVHRLTTVRTIARRVREAMGTENVSALLAGLDQHYAPRRFT